MNIGLLLDAYKPVVNGITNFVSAHRHALEDLGHHTTIFTWGAEDGHEEEPSIVRSRPLVRLGDTGYAVGVQYSSRARQQLQEMDILHVHHPFLAGRMALRHARTRGIPIVYTNHTRYDLYARYYLHLPDSVARLLLKAVLPDFCAACDRVVVPSPVLHPILRGWGVKSDIQVIPNGIQIHCFRCPDRTFTREQLQLGPEHIVLIYAGRLGPEKNLPLLLQAFAFASYEVPELRLVLVGGGPEDARLWKLSQDLGVTSIVRFTGPVRYEQLPSYLALADVFATASVTEVHPLSILEALAAALPVAGVRSAGVGHMVRDGWNGLLSVEDASAFAAILIRLGRDAGLRAHLAAAAEESSHAFDITGSTAQYVRCYEKLVAHGKPV